MNPEPHEGNQQVAMHPVLRHTAHRPYPVPSRPWVLSQQWQHLLFAHWPIAPEALRALLPAGLQLDTWADRAWVGVVPFAMNQVAPRFLPAVPGLSRFPELNVRTYVRGGGVYFFSLDASSRVAVGIARRFFHLPYFEAQMQFNKTSEGIIFESRRSCGSGARAEFSAAYGPAGAAVSATSGSIENWLTERYRFFSSNAAGQLMVGDIHHQPWSLQPAWANISSNTMCEAAGIPQPRTSPLLHYSASLDVVAWPVTTWSA
jgi:uncharacterized protein